jgi:ribosomal protein S18 acetylase RimI-like enzyme
MDSELPAEADASLWNTIRHLTRHAAAGRVEERDGLLLFAGAHDMPHAYVNGVIRTDGAVRPGLVVNQAQEFFAPLKRPFTLWASAHGDADIVQLASERRLFSYRPEGSPEMVLRRDPGPTAPTSVRLCSVQEAATHAHFIAVVEEAYAHVLPAGVARAVFADPKVINGEDACAFVVLEGDRPIAAAMVTLFVGLGEIGFVGTVPDARGRGAGRLVTQACAHDAFARGAQRVFLQASAMGEPVYRRLGFEEITRYMRYDVAYD